MPPQVRPRRRSVFTSRLRTSAAPGEPARVLDDIRAAILGGDEPPGTLIPLDAVAQVFGVSPIPVREALKVLCGEGLVDHVPRVGYSVAKLTYPEFCELYDVRQALEAAALRSAVERASAEDDAEVRALHAAAEQAVAERDERAYHRASRQFHLALIAPSGMARLVHLYLGAWNMTEPARPMARVSTPQRSGLVHDHEAMLAAFLARDADGLAAECATHYEHLRAAISPLADDGELFRR